MPEASAEDSPTFRQLFDAHAEALRRYARRIVRSREVAEDLVQEVFFRLWRGRDTIEMGPAIRSYLYVATRSRALNYVKHEQIHARAQSRAYPPDEAALGPEADRALEVDDISCAIEQVLATMPPRQREVAALRLRDQMPTAAIAHRLGISPRTVEVHIARATKALRAQLPALLAR
jgi:RNA polymerase sigma-70 factor (ECF subfamily)